MTKVGEGGGHKTYCQKLKQSILYDQFQFPTTCGKSPLLFYEWMNEWIYSNSVKTSYKLVKTADTESSGHLVPIW